MLSGTDYDGDSKKQDGIRMAFKVGDALECLLEKDHNWHPCTIRRIKRSKKKPGLIVYDVYMEEFQKEVSVQRHQLRNY